MTEKINEVELFTEILASESMGTYAAGSQWIVDQLGDNPSIIWDRLRFDPWTAMAVYEDMEEKDSTLFSCLEKRRDGVLSLPRQVIPASDKRQDKKIAEFVEETLNDYWGGIASTLDSSSHESPFESFLAEALEAVGDGMNLGEIIFAEASDRIFIEEVKFKPQQLFAFGDTALAQYSTASMAYPQTGQLRLRAGVSIDSLATGAELPEYKFFVFSYRSRKGNRWGRPLKRLCFWQTWIKRNGVKAWLRYIEKGAGTVTAKYNDGAAEKEMQDARDVAMAVQEESAVAYPKKFLLEVHEMVRNIGTSHKELVDDYCNAEISRAIVGQTLTGRGSDGGGSRALGEVHERVEAKKVESDAKALMASVNSRIIRPLVHFNFGPNAKLPKWILEYEQSEDLNKAAERYGKLRKEVGLPLSTKHLYEAFQTPEPEDEQDALTPDQAPNSAQPDPLNDPQISEFAEKKKPLHGSGSPSNLRMERFARHSLSMIEFLDE